MDRRSKNYFVDLINNVAGEQIMTEKKLGQIMEGAKKEFDDKGTKGLLGYLGKVTQAPVSTDWMADIVDQMKTPDGMKEVIDQFQIPIEVKKGNAGKPVVEMKSEKQSGGKSTKR